MKDILVVKLGGSLLENASARAAAIEAIAAQANRGSHVVVVHGGGKHIDAALTQAGIPKTTVEGLRVTDEATLDIVTGVLSGRVNKLLVSELAARGVDAAGVSGVDGATLEADFHPAIGGQGLGYVGALRACDPSLVLTLIGAGFVPVIASIAAGPEGSILNINADSAASMIAITLGASRIVFLTDVEGLIGADGSVVSQLDQGGAMRMLNDTAVTGVMKPKLRACVAAVAGGVPEVVIAGPSRHASALSGGEGGTTVVAA